MTTAASIRAAVAVRAGLLVDCGIRHDDPSMGARERAAHPCGHQVAPGGRRASPSATGPSAGGPAVADVEPGDRVAPHSPAAAGQARGSAWRIEHELSRLTVRSRKSKALALPKLPSHLKFTPESPKE